MTNYYRPHLCSEINDPDHHVDDCAWCSANMLANAMTGGKYPSSLVEAEQIELAAGGPYPSGSPSLAYDGIHKRYGLTPGLATSEAGLMVQAKPGTSLLVSGLYGNLPPNYRRWSPFFTGHHELYVGVETTTTGWLIDPLGVNYAGEGITLANVAAFAKGGLGGLFAPTHIIPVVTHHLNTAPNATIRIATVSGGCISKWTNRKWGATASSAPCSAPYTLKGCSSGSAAVVKVTKGVFAGQVVKASSPGVSVT